MHSTVVICVYQQGLPTHDKKESIRNTVPLKVIVTGNSVQSYIIFSMFTKGKG